MRGEFSGTLRRPNMVTKNEIGLAGHSNRDSNWAAVKGHSFAFKLKLARLVLNLKPGPRL